MPAWPSLLAKQQLLDKAQSSIEELQKKCEARDAALDKLEAEHEALAEKLRRAEERSATEQTELRKALADVEDNSRVQHGMELRVAGVESELKAVKDELAKERATASAAPEGAGRCQPPAPRVGSEATQS